MAGHRDPVTAEVRIAVIWRDAGCVAAKLDNLYHECKGPLTLDHVKDQPRMGKRAPSDMAHLVTLCRYHHLGASGWATANRPKLREYLRSVENDSDSASGGTR